jgi:uncharacterized protein
MTLALLGLTACGWLGGADEPADPARSACPLGPPQACFDAGEALLRESPPDLAGAAARFEEACADGQLRACTSLGLQLQDGRGVPREPRRAEALYEQACQGGLGVGCLNLAWLHQTGNAGIADQEAAARAYGLALDKLRASCAPPDPTDCANLGLVLETGFGVTLPDPRGAKEAWELGCDHGEADACTNLALASLERGEPDVASDVDQLTRACREGSASGCKALGQVLYRGAMGIPRDPARAVGVLTRACDLGEPTGCTSLSGLLAAADEVRADPARALGAAARGCSLGDSTGCLILAHNALADGEAASAAEHFTAACHIGDRGACAMLGAMVQRGELGPPDPERAAHWFTEGCRREEPTACAELLRAGRSLPLNSLALDTFLDEACTGGLAEACEIVAPPLSPPLDPRGSGSSP